MNTTEEQDYENMKEWDRLTELGELHYHTQRILDRTFQSGVSDAVIHTDPVNEYSVNKVDPLPVKELVPELNKLFNSGHDIVLETNQGYDDEGGDCYQAYIIKPEHKEAFWKYYNENIDRDGKMLWQLCIFEYILANPSHFITLWAGPY